MSLTLSETLMDRRRFSSWLALGMAGCLYPGLSRGLVSPPRTLRVAALQMTPKLGDVPANLEQAERLILEAQRRGADWIALPEMFTTAAAFHPAVLAGIRSVEGAPAKLLMRLARQGQSIIGGSFLASRGGQVYNSFLLAFPDGSTQRHDKDQPTYWENCYYRGGADDGVLATPLGNVGSALSWEFIRSRTMRRMRGRVRMVLGGSCWWTLSDDVEAGNPLRAINLNMLRDAPVHCARILGVPVVHGSHAGRFEGFFSPDLSDVPYDSHYLGEAMVVDAEGRILSRRAAAEGPGVVFANIDLPAEPVPSLPLPESFWMPEDMPEPWKDSWTRWLSVGTRYYENVTRPYLKTGEVNEYVPEYMQ